LKELDVKRHDYERESDQKDADPITLTEIAPRRSLKLIAARASKRYWPCALP